MSHDLERIRDYVEGRLPPAEREAFAAEIARDAVLAELVETYELVVCATSDPAPAATTSFGDVVVRARAPRRVPRPLLAAAALLLAVGIFFLAWSSLRMTPTSVTLTSIPLAVRPAPGAPPEWPRELAAHRTADEDGLLFYDDMATAQAVAKAAKAPIFLFIHFPGCPWCKEFREVQCRDGDVIKAAEPYVLLTLDWRKAPAALREDPNEGWPLFDILDADGRKLDGFKGLEPAMTVAAFLSKRGFPRPDWEGLGEGARKLEEAEEAKGAAARLALYRQVAAAGNVLGDAARARIAEMEKSAQDALFAARDEFLRKGAAAAADRLGAAALAFRGTPYGDDLERIHTFVREHGSFPDLKE
ncbi:MAG TPA: thioredoxin family protein [Planctomycetota bacterium]|nr:thioredoxin family protein [Planctomycetota bacterium]